MERRTVLACAALAMGLNQAHAQFGIQQHIFADCAAAPNARLTHEFTLSIPKELQFFAGRTWKAVPTSASVGASVFVPTEKDVLSFVAGNTKFSTGLVDGRTKARLSTVAAEFCSESETQVVEYTVEGRYTFNLKVRLLAARADGLVQTDEQRANVLRSISYTFREFLSYVFGAEQRWLMAYETAANNTSRRSEITQKLCGGACSWDGHSVLALRLGLFLEKYPSPWTDEVQPPQSLSITIDEQPVSHRNSGSSPLTVPFFINNIQLAQPFKDFGLGGLPRLPPPKFEVPEPKPPPKEFELVLRVVAKDDETSFVEFGFDGAAGPLIVKAVSIGGQRE